MRRTSLLLEGLLAAVAILTVAAGSHAATSGPCPHLAMPRGAGGAAASGRLQPVCPPTGSGGDAWRPGIPTVEGPVEGGHGTPFIAGTAYDLSLDGYSQEEFFISGTARAFTALGKLGSDGRWRAVPAESASYETRIVVHRPTDPERFSGTVLVEWLNVSGGLDASPDWTSSHVELIRKGHVWVGVSAQQVGVEGGTSAIGLGAAGLKTSDPERYASLHHPGDSFSYDMFSQAGQAIRHPVGLDPLRGLAPERVIAIGESQSAFRLTTYVNAVDPLARVYNGFLVHSRGGGSASLAQAPQPLVQTPDVVRIRSDARVPVLIFQTETDLLLLDYLPDRQPDTGRVRLWEVAGTAHADTYTLAVGMTDRGDSPEAADLLVTSEPLAGFACASPINSGPQHFVLKAAIAALERWVRTGDAPPRAPRIEVTLGSPAAIARDRHGNALGGIRTPYVDVPIATLSGEGQKGSTFCFLFGTTTLLDEATLDSLYADHDAYAAAVAKAARKAVRSGFLLEPDADLIERAATASDVGR